MWKSQKYVETYRIGRLNATFSLFTHVHQNDIVLILLYKIGLHLTRNAFVHKLCDFLDVKTAIWLTSATTPNVLTRTF